MLGFILIDDRRYEHTLSFLAGQGHLFGEKAENLDFIVFPFVAGIDENVYDDEYFAAIKKDAVIFSGVRNDYVMKKCAQYGLEYYVMMNDAEVAKKNAVPTSEGVIEYLITSRDSTIAGSRILVMGYGTCGRDLAGRLAALDADVYALVRNAQKEALARADAVTSINLSQLFAYSFDVIINTVPSTILTDEMIRRLGGVLMVDIASKPYGFNMALARSLNEKSALLSAIPGKYAVKTAGKILGQYIENILGGDRNDI